MPSGHFYLVVTCLKTRFLFCVLFTVKIFQNAFGSLCRSQPVVRCLLGTFSHLVVKCLLGSFLILCYLYGRNKKLPFTFSQPVIQCLLVTFIFCVIYVCLYARISDVDSYVDERVPKYAFWSLSSCCYLP